MTYDKRKAWRSPGYINLPLPQIILLPLMYPHFPVCLCTQVSPYCVSTS